MNTSRTIVEAFGTRARFVTMLVAAELNASSDWECRFTNQVRDRFERYDERTTISPLQKKQLHQLAGI